MTAKDIALLIVKESEQIKNPDPVSRIYTLQMMISNEVINIMVNIRMKERLNHDSKINKK